LRAAAAKALLGLEAARNAAAFGESKVHGMSDENTLDAIGSRHGTDKASHAHDYLRFYESLFAPMRDQNITILEFGIWQGASLSTWADYFPNAKIVGADINATTRRLERERVHVEILDQSNIEEVTRLAVKHGPFDLVIDDGSHMWEHQITSLRTMFPFLRNNGYYIVEDLQTNYGSMTSSYRGVSSQSCMDYLKSWVDLHTGDNQVAIADVEDAFLRTYGRAAESITFFRRACAIRKRFHPVLRIPAYGEPLAQIPFGAASAIRVFAHISHRGDVAGVLGYVNLPSNIFSFQAVALESNDDILEYRVRGPDQSWTDWAPTNTLLGTRGQARLLTGISVRLKPEARELYGLRVVARFSDGAAPVEAASGEDCASADGAALCGLQVELTKQAA
jgi:cephalosporin hydroxylase